MNKDNKKEVLLSVRHLCQYFSLKRKDFKAVDDVSFDVYKGEVFGLVGESGCGKTTTGRSIIKIYNITSGDIIFKGVRIGAGIRSYQNEIRKLRKENRRLTSEILKEDNEAKKASFEKEKLLNLEKIAKQKEEILKARHDQKYCDKDFANLKAKEVSEKYDPMLKKAEKKALAEPNEDNLKALKALKKEYRNELHLAKKSKIVTSIQMIFQDPIGSLNPRMTVEEIISEGLIVKGVKGKKHIQEEVYKMLDMVGLLKEHASRYPHEFSGGQRQRIGIARSIIMQPDMIIADEPVSALDVSIQAQVINLLNELRDKLGLTILFIAHDLSVVKYFSDRIGVMYYGKLVELASSDELFAHPLHPYTKSLLSAIPLPDPLYEKKRVRINYNPITDHDYSIDLPSLREVSPNHFVYCNDFEEQEYKKIVMKK